MVIEVDDSGWGDLVGGVVIVMRRVETNENHVGVIPLELFQENHFKYKVYLRHTLQVILDGIDNLKISKDEPIHICTGYIFKNARESLKQLGYQTVEAKIIGATQTLAEIEFLNHLERLGLGKASELRNIRSFNGFLDWLREDPENRKQYFKTGWKSWPRLRERIMQENRD
jgi:hypothetical protein